jgi:hypothetical protein
MNRRPRAQMMHKQAKKTGILFSEAELKVVPDLIIFRVSGSSRWPPPCTVT